MLHLSKAAAAPATPKTAGPYPECPTCQDTGAQALRDHLAEAGDRPVGLCKVVPAAHAGEAEIAVAVVEAKGICEMQKGLMFACVSQFGAARRVLG